MSAIMGDSYPKNGRFEQTTAVRNVVPINVIEKGVLRFSLKQFIECFVCHNTLVRLWKKPCKGGRKMILTENGSQICMEWEILKGTVHKDYANCYVVGVTDILCEKDNEAVNIVIDVED